MLSLQLKDGEYLTIGEDIVIQVFTTSAIRMSIQAPKELPILRSEVRERSGKEQPACLRDERRKNAGTASNSTVSSS